MAQESSPLSPSSTSYKRPNHNRQSSTRSLSFLILYSSPSSSTTSSSYRPSSNYTMPTTTSSALGLQVPTPLHPNFTRRASDGYTSGSSSSAGRETLTPTTPTPISSSSASSSFVTLSSPNRVKRSCSTSALTALSLSSASSPRLRQITGKATVAEPALVCTNSDIGDLYLSSRSRSESVSTLNDLILPPPSSQSSLPTSPSPSSSSATSLSSSQQHPISRTMSPVNSDTVSTIVEKRRPSLTSFMSNLITSWNQQSPPPQQQQLHAQNDEDAQEILSSSSMSSPVSSNPPTTPTSNPTTPGFSSPTQRSVSLGHVWQSGINEEQQQRSKASPRSKNAQLSPLPPSKRTRSNTVNNTCLKSSLALQNVTEKSVLAQNSDVTPRKRASNLSLRGLPAFQYKGDESGLSPKSPRSPLAQLSFSPQAQVGEPEPEAGEAGEVKRARAATTGVVGGTSFGSLLLLPSTLSADSSAPSTPLTPLHTVYIDHIAVAYNPSSSSGQECKKLLMRLERFKKRSSVDITSLSTQQATSILNANNSSTGKAEANTGVNDENRRKSYSTPTSARISRCNSAGNVNGSPAPGVPHACIATAGHCQTFKVTAKIRDHREPNKIEAVYVDGFRVVFDATGMSHLDMLERIGHHAYVMARRNAN